MKDKFDKGNHRDLKVAAPLVGAWIEMLSTKTSRLSSNRRTPRGCVD